MITHLGLIILVVLFYELLNYIKFRSILIENISFYKKIIKLLKYKNVSDNWKQKSLLNYSKNILLISLKIIFILLIIVSFLIIFGKFQNNYYNLLLSLPGIIEVIILFIVYSYLRKKINAKL